MVRKSFLLMNFYLRKSSDDINLCKFNALFIYERKNNVNKKYNCIKKLKSAK